MIVSKYIPDEKFMEFMEFSSKDAKIGES